LATQRAVVTSWVRAMSRRAPSNAALAERVPQLREMLGRARRRGEAVPTVDELLELVVAPLYFHALFAAPASVEHAHRLVGRLLEVANGREAADQQVPN
jgi:tetracycline repressor-like protein